MAYHYVSPNRDPHTNVWWNLDITNEEVEHQHYGNTVFDAAQYMIDTKQELRPGKHFGLTYGDKTGLRVFVVNDNYEPEDIHMYISKLRSELDKRIEAQDHTEDKVDEVIDGITDVVNRVFS